jgi:hypothetical protein
MPQASLLVQSCYIQIVRSTINISEPVLRSARRRASERGVTLSAFAEDALRAQLARKESAAAPPFRLHTVRGRLVLPDLDLDRTSALLALDDEAGFGGRG